MPRRIHTCVIDRTRVYIYDDDEEEENKLTEMEFKNRKLMDGETQTAYRTTLTVILKKRNQASITDKFLKI